MYDNFDKSCVFHNVPILVVAYHLLNLRVPSLLFDMSVDYLGWIYTFDLNYYQFHNRLDRVWRIDLACVIHI